MSSPHLCSGELTKKRCPFRDYCVRYIIKDLHYGIDYIHPEYNNSRHECLKFIKSEIKNEISEIKSYY
jgi:hypothetical protein